MQTPHLSFYHKYLKSGILPHDGLCNCCNHGLNAEVLELFTPTNKDSDRLIRAGYSSSYWGSELTIHDSDQQRRYGFTPLRQTIVLFMAAINNEL